MGWALDDQDKEEVRHRIPLEDLIRDYSIALQPSGAGRLRALCPFHREKTPSFYVNTDKQFYHCFGCKEHGDIFTLVEKLDHVDFSEALEILARRAGVELKHRGLPGDGGSQKVALFDALALAQDFYHRILLEDPRGEPGRRYLEGRRISGDLWKRFHLGFSLPEWDGLIRFAALKKVPADILERAGLARAREGGSGHYDYFRGRVMFPIADAQKRVIGFGARTLSAEDQPKYLNTPKTAVFEKGQVLYGLPLARAAIGREARVAIMEGYTDVIMAHQEGLEHAVASLGTAFTAENARRLRSLAPRVDLIFDGDAAGQSATEKSLELLVSEDLDVRIYSVTNGKDPCDALLELGGSAFRKRIDAEALGIFEFKWKRTVEDAEARGEGPAGVARAFDGVVALLAKVPNVVARKLQARGLAEKLGLDEGDIQERLKKFLAGASSLAGAPAAPDKAPDTQSDLDDVLLECLLAEPEKARERRRQVPEGLWPFNPAPEAAGPGGPSALIAVALAMDRQIGTGGLDARALLGQIHEEASRQALMGILARLDMEDGGSSGGRDDVWKNCLRDLTRRDLERRRKALELELTRLRGRADPERLNALERERYDLLRRLKSPIEMGEPGGERSTVLQGEPEKGIAS